MIHKFFRQGVYINPYKSFCGIVTKDASLGSYFWKHVDCEKCRSAVGVLRKLPKHSSNAGSLKLLKRCREYIEGVSGRSLKGDQLLLDLIEQLQADT